MQTHRPGTPYRPEECSQYLQAGHEGYDRGKYCKITGEKEKIGRSDSGRRGLRRRKLKPGGSDGAAAGLIRAEIGNICLQDRGACITL